MKYYRAEIRLLVAIVLLFILMFFVSWSEYNSDISNWNNGVCVECNGRIKFASASRNRNSEFYYYSCDDCGHTIRTYHRMK